MTCQENISEIIIMIDDFRFRVKNVCDSAAAWGFSTRVDAGNACTR